MNPFRKIKAYLRYREAVRKADEAHERTGARYYVMPASGTKKVLLIMDRSNFRKLRHTGYITNKAFVADLNRECFYATPYRNGSIKMSASVIKLKRQQYYAWYNGKAQRKAKH